MNRAKEAPGRLLGDVGGTNIRLAWQAVAGAPLVDERRYPCADFPDIEHALRQYLQDTGRPVAEAALGMANPVTGDQVRMTNHDWQFSIRALQAAMGWRRLVVVNDFAALALALPDLRPEELRAVGGGAAVAGQPCALIGPGTGLGVATLLSLAGAPHAPSTPSTPNTPDGMGRWHVLPGEGGHVTLPAQTALEWQVLEHLAARHSDHVSAERVLSGPGLEALYAALCAIADAGGPVAAAGLSPSEGARRPAAGDSPALDAAAITAAALSGEPRARQALEMFCAFLGTVAGDLALTVGARGGVYIGGGIVPRLGDFFLASPFRARFEAKGRFASLLAGIPCWVITSPDSPALRGAARALDLAAASQAG